MRSCVSFLRSVTLQIKRKRIKSMRCKIFKKAVCMTMAILMLCVSINAQELQTNPDSEVITPRYSYTDDAYADLSISSSGAASCSASATATSPSYEVDLTMTLQRNNGGWKTVRSWTNSADWSVSLNGTWYVTPGYDYRVETKATVKNSSGHTLETVMVHSSIVEY